MLLFVDLACQNSGTNKVFVKIVLDDLLLFPSILSSAEIYESYFLPKSLMSNIDSSPYLIFPSGIRSSTTTYIMAPAAKARAYGSIGSIT